MNIPLKCFIVFYFSFFNSSDEILLKFIKGLLIQVPEGLFFVFFKFLQAKFDLLNRFVFVCSEYAVPEYEDVGKIGIGIMLILLMMNFVNVREL